MPDRIEEASLGWHEVQIELGGDDALLPFPPGPRGQSLRVHHDGVAR